MTVEDLNLALVPVIEAIEYQSQVTYGVIVGLGLVAGVLLIKLLLDRF